MKKMLAVTAVAAMASMSMLAMPAAQAAEKKQQKKSPATLNAYGVAVSALGQTLVAQPIATGANDSATLLSVGLPPLLTSGTLTATTATTAGTGTEVATATTQNMSLSFLGAGATLNAVSSTCTANFGATPTGTAQIAGGTLSGPLGIPTISIASNPAINTVYGIPGIVTLTANEHINNPDGSLTVNALHFRFLGGTGGDIVIASSTCGPAVAPVPIITAEGAAAAAGLGILGFAGFKLRPSRRRRVSTAAI